MAYTVVLTRRCGKLVEREVTSQEQEHVENVNAIR